jgi:hypothetical protein
VTLHGSIDTLDSNIHLPFSITSSTSMSSPMLALLKWMIHRIQVLVDPSLITIMIHTSLHVFDKLTFVTLLFVDVDEYVFRSSIYFKVAIDMRHRSSILCSFSSFDEIPLVIWHTQICNHHCYNVGVNSRSSLPRTPGTNAGVRR